MTGASVALAVGAVWLAVGIACHLSRPACRVARLAFVEEPREHVRMAAGSSAE
jgi:hypothetical protein